MENTDLKGNEHKTPEEAVNADMNQMEAMADLGVFESFNEEEELNRINRLNQLEEFTKKLEGKVAKLEKDFNKLSILISHLK